MQIPAETAVVHARKSRAHSSAGERSLHTGEVQGSIPCAPTRIANKQGLFSTSQKFQSAVQYGTKREMHNSTRGLSVDLFTARSCARVDVSPRLSRSLILP